MGHDFNSVIDRKNTDSKKWDIEGDGLIPFSIADMDFQSPKAVTDALIKRAEHGVYGYTYKSEKYYESIINWTRQKYGLDINEESICHSPGIVTALNIIVNTFSSAGDSIIIQPPVYYPFINAIANNNREIIYNHLVWNEDKYVMNLEDLKKKIIDSKAKILLLCNPHNPVGRVWTEEELEEIGNICIENNVLVVSDEVHADIVFNGHKHTSFASLSKTFADHSITCIAPSKTFNLAGVQMSAIIIPNEQLRSKYMNMLMRLSLDKVNPFGQVALEAAYSKGEKWLEELLVYLEENLAFASKYIEENIPEMKVIQPEGTYLLWIDCTSLHLTDKELEQWMRNDAKVNVRHGYQFGPGGQNFIRINFACPRSILEQGLSQIREAVDKRKVK